MDEGITKSFNAKGGKAPKPVTPAQRREMVEQAASMEDVPVLTRPGEASRNRLMSALMFSKSAYDDEFDRIHNQFLPLLNDLDRGMPRNIIFVDPSEYAGAKALGIGGQQYLSTSLALNGVYASSASMFAMDMALTATDKRTKGHTMQATSPVAEPAGAGNSCVIVPLSHFGNTGVDIKGMTAAEISTYVNYHEYFHCLNDVYNNDISQTAPQKREMFSDVGAAMEMIRRGSNPAIIDHIIEWREKQPDATHHTVEGLKALKEIVQSAGVDNIKGMTPKEVLAMSYVITDNASSSPIGYKWLEIKEKWNTPGPLSKIISSLFEGPRENALPKGFDPQKALEEKAIRLGGKVTPVTLVQANAELQREYRAQYDKTSGQNEMYPQMMIATQDAFAKSVRTLDYEAVNRNRKATLTAEDREDITYVRYGGAPPEELKFQKPVSTASATPASATTAGKPKPQR